MKFFAIVLLLLQSVTLAQIRTYKIDGVVKDAETGTLLPFADIRIVHRPFATFTNSQGQMALGVSSFPVEIIVTYVGYETDTVTVAERDTGKILMVSLKKKDILFPEVEILASDTFAINLVRRVYNKIVENQDKQITGRAFYRQYGKTDTGYTEILEMFLSTLLNDRGIVKRAIEQGRYASVKHPGDTTAYFSFANLSDLSTTTFKVSQSKPSFFSFLPFVSKPAIYVPIRKDADRYFYLRTAGVYRLHGREIATIQFSPKPNLDKPAFVGNMEVDAHSYQVLRIQEKVGANFFDGIEYKGYYWVDDTLSYKVTFKRTGGDENAIEYLETIFTMHERNRFDPSFDRRCSFHSFLIFYGYGDGRDFSNEGKPNEGKDIENIMRAGYDPEFWKKHQNVINEIPMEKNIKESFIKHGFYGNLFPGGEPLNEK